MIFENMHECMMPYPNLKTGMLQEPAGGGHGRGGLPSAGRGFFVWIEDIRVQSFLWWAIVSDVQDGMFLKGGSVKLSRITGFHWSPTT
jgi:hypothetical protein